MTPTDLLIEIGLPVGGLAAWFAVYATARLLTRPRTAVPAPATMDLPGTEPPAVVSLLANGWRITVDAAESTLLDLAARGYLELRPAGPDPRQTTVHLTGRDPGDLNRYERQVHRRVVERAAGGVVPLTALGFADAGRAASWANRLGKAVVADARRLGLSRRRFSPGLVTALGVLGGVAAAGVAAGLLHLLHRRGEEYGAVLGAYVIVTAVLGGIAGRVRDERDTPAGRQVAARWLGVREWLVRHESFAELPPAAVAVWDRYLPYGAALGVTRVASRAVDLGVADRRRLWSSYTGAWRQVRVSYPRGLPRYGQRLGWIVFRAALAALVGWTFTGRGEVVSRLADATPVTAGFTLAGLVLLGYAGYLTVRVVLDLVAPTTVSGEVLWRQTWRTRQQGESGYVPVNFHLAIDDGRSDRTRAWVLPAELGDICRLGDVVTVRVRPWTRRVLAATVERRAAVPVDPDEDLDPAVGSPAGR
ncbi:hypothetical protein AB0J86_31345 [Micromonospora sp. NPDC049559]|uniref:DUF2207 family protein n=1 Tax=Micromonospora sp. NPDC049559 TaxID=3155923 RepID=UPI00341E832D